jgi:ABC-type proline/glycine betaine transport system permease subunit
LGYRPIVRIRRVVVTVAFLALAAYSGIGAAGTFGNLGADGPDNEPAMYILVGVVASLTTLLLLAAAYITVTGRWAAIREWDRNRHPPL